MLLVIRRNNSNFHYIHPDLDSVIPIETRAYYRNQDFDLIIVPCPVWSKIYRCLPHAPDNPTYSSLPSLCGAFYSDRGVALRRHAGRSTARIISRVIPEPSTSRMPIGTDQFAIGRSSFSHRGCTQQNRDNFQIGFPAKMRPPPNKARSIRNGSSHAP